MKDRVYWLGFSVFPGIGPKKFGLLRDVFSSGEVAWTADEKELSDVLGPRITEKFLRFRQNFSFDDYQQKLEKAQVWYVTLDDSDFPGILKKSYNPPFVLYGKGEKDTLLEKRTIGIVGTRKVTSYGKQVTEMITRDLLDFGFCIISGLAMGVDAVAHATTVSQSGKTVAVLGCGVDCCNPRVNQQLYERIIAHGGCVVSEFPLSQDPTIGSFPSRNRIIAGLSEAIIVTEGAEDSGALITAEDASKNNRPVFAVPGSITSSLSQGPNKLLQQGAFLITRGEDVIHQLGDKSGKKSQRGRTTEITGETKEEQQIIDVLKDEEHSFDELIKKTGYASSQLNMLLSLMEIKGLLHHTETGNYYLVF